MSHAPSQDARLAVVDDPGAACASCAELGVRAGDSVRAVASSDNGHEVASGDSARQPSQFLATVAGRDRHATHPSTQRGRNGSRPGAPVGDGGSAAPSDGGQPFRRLSGRYDQGVVTLRGAQLRHFGAAMVPGLGSAQSQTAVKSRTTGDGVDSGPAGSGHLDRSESHRATRPHDEHPLAGSDPHPVAQCPQGSQAAQDQGAVLDPGRVTVREEPAARGLDGEQFDRRSSAAQRLEAEDDGDTRARDDTLGAAVDYKTEIGRASCRERV